MYFYIYTFLIIFNISLIGASNDLIDTTEEAKNDKISGAGFVYFKGDIVNPCFRKIEKLAISGSQQYTIDYFKDVVVKTLITECRVPLRRIIFVDLREEPHFMFGCNSTVSIEGAKADAYRGLSVKKIMQIEDDFSQNFPPYITEKECIEASGAKYQRFAVTDVTRPEDSDVDEFIDFFRKLEKIEHTKGKKYWLHFHCLAGQGRTTTFMSMFEMLKTAGTNMLPFKQLLDRQHAIGGADLSNMWYSGSGQAWSEFLEHFYEYAKDFDKGYRSGALWSEWRSINGFEKFQEKSLHYSNWSLNGILSNMQAATMVAYMKISQLYRHVLVK